MASVEKGHGAHSQAADSQLGLPGVMPRTGALERTMRRRDVLRVGQALHQMLLLCACGFSVERFGL